MHKMEIQHTHVPFYLTKHASGLLFANNKRLLTQESQTFNMVNDSDEVMKITVTVLTEKKMKKPIGPVSSIPLILTTIDSTKSQHEITKFIKKK